MFGVQSPFEAYKKAFPEDELILTACADLDAAGEAMRKAVATNKKVPSAVCERLGIMRAKNLEKDQYV